MRTQRPDEEDGLQMLSRRGEEGARNDEGKTMAGSWKGEQQEKGEGMSEQERSYIWSGEVRSRACNYCLQCFTMGITCVCLNT